MRAIFALAIVLGGCSRPGPSSDGGSGGELLYLVHNQVWRIGLDGSGAQRLGTIGDDAHRTGFPRRLADGRVALLADDTGAIHPYVTDGRASLSIGATNVTLHDALCTLTVAGAGALVYTVTPFAGGSAQLMRADPSVGEARLVADEEAGVVSEPAPWDDGAVLVVRSARGLVTLEILDVAGAATRELLATIDAPYSAHTPARLPDGRVVFVRTDRATRPTPPSVSCSSSIAAASRAPPASPACSRSSSPAARWCTRSAAPTVSPTSCAPTSSIRR